MKVINLDRDHNPSSSGGSSDEDSGKEGDRSGSDSDSDKNRRKRGLTPSQQEWEKVTGQKQSTTKHKSKALRKANKLVKLPTPETIDAKAEKWRDSITFDQYV